jgi:TetR/AcrR family transcriptional regulator, transcriptional repressor for nem operon
MKFEAGIAVDRAMDVFWQRGYGGTTPQVLLDALGIGKGSFYNTFESKHKVFTLALERYKDNRILFLGETFEAPGPMRSRIHSALRELTGLESHRRGCLMVNSTAELAQDDAAVKRIADDLFAGIEAAFRDAIERGRQEGEFSPSIDVAGSATSLLATLVGTSVLLKTGADVDQVARALGAAVQAL